MNVAGIEKLFQSYKKDVRKVIFPQGKKELTDIISSIASINNIDFETIDYTALKGICDIYVDTFVLKAARQEDLDIISNMPKKHGTYVKTLEDACKTMSFIFLHQSNGFIYENKDNEEFNDIAQSYLDSFKFIKQNEGLENIYLKDSDYGLVKEKPIYTHGQTGTENYFAQLLDKKEQDLIYEYEDSLVVDGINGFVDVYSLKLESGEEVNKIYINRYGNKNSNNAPKGYKLKKVNIDKALDKSEENVRKELTRTTRFELITFVVAAIVVIYLLFFRK